ncbi:MAG: sulfite exporter TauE/SafE family protein [Spirosomaceae bacterium]|jgi:hypothetical protein|nr:sulfite exporter TauE/SafE family protein [Spirosomataceae bacterium]
MLEIIGYGGALLVGVSLGLMGGGGSILTVPILAYCFGFDTVTATAYSLFIVGLTSLMGSSSYLVQREVHLTTALAFGLPSVVSVYLTRYYLVPAIPAKIAQIGGFVVEKNTFLLLLFAVLMLLAAFFMIRKKEQHTEGISVMDTGFGYPFLAMEGLGLGFLTGLLGAGGGFLIIPALVLLAQLPMKQAVGTSLLIIACNSLVGFWGSSQVQNNFDWDFLLTFSGISVVGIIIGSLFSKRISNEQLKPTFGYFVLTMGVYIIIKEVFF